VKFRLSIKYLCAFIIVFGIEAIIAIFIHDSFIRPYLGDVLVVVLIYCLIKTFAESETKLLPLYIFLFACLVELGQYFNAAKLLGLSSYTITRILIGSTFDVKDIACYAVGCTGLALFEMIVRSTHTKNHAR